VTTNVSKSKSMIYQIKKNIFESKFDLNKLKFCSKIKKKKPLYSSFLENGESIVFSHNKCCKLILKWDKICRK